MPINTESVLTDWWGLITDKEYLENPYPKLRELQNLGPLHLDNKTGVYFVLGHHEFGLIARSSRMGRDTRLWCDGWNSPNNKVSDPISHELFSEFQSQMIMMNEPDHGRMRSVYQQAFKPSAIETIRPMIEYETDLILDQLSTSTEVNLIENFAAPLPLRVLRNLLEIPADMDDDMRRWSSSLIKIGDVMMTSEQKADALIAMKEFKCYLRDHIKNYRNKDSNTLMHSVILAFESGFMNEQETLTNLMSMLVAGHETTVTLIGNGMLALLRHPSQKNLLASEPKLIKTALDEFLRYEPGGNMIIRVAIEDFELDGITIPAGALVIGMIGAINRDPKRFNYPDILNIQRKPNPHFTYGAGIYICIGAPLAHLESEIAFNKILKKFPDIELSDEPVWRLDRLNARGLMALPVRLRTN